MTLWEALKIGEKYLEKREIPDAALDAWYLLEDILKQEYGEKVNRAWFLLNRQEEIGEGLHTVYRQALEQRGIHVPLQYITGEQEFMGIPFLVNHKVLIPRQDTEILVEEVMKTARPGMKLLDMCTGSGCIAISLVKMVPGLEATASDLSGEALEVARENARRQETEITFVQGNLFEAVKGQFDIIVSNPPYIPAAEIEELMEEVRLFEPRAALDGREDGLYFYQRIIEESPGYMKEGGWLIFEIGCSQGEQVSELMKDAGFSHVSICKDLAGLDRVVKGRLGCKP
ncbi:peptide chain release factor N(5)-glutamine methyltransferase [Lachnospiraceae bacterium 46-15]